MSPAQLGRVDWTDELLNWITKYEMIVVALTLVGAAAPCSGAPIRQGIQEAKANSKHTIIHTYHPLKPCHTHIGSWLYCFYGWLIHEPVLRFGYDDKPQISSIASDKALNCRYHTGHSSQFVTPNP
jgi:hypothetical protein